MQTAVDAAHHLIVAHEVTNVGHDRGQLANKTKLAQAEIGAAELEVLANRGYFSGEEILACEALGATLYVPKPLTSGAKAEGRFGEPDFIYEPEDDVYRCPAGQKLLFQMTTVENGMVLRRYWGPRQLPGLRPEAPRHDRPQPPITRWEHEAVIAAMQARMDLAPNIMRVRRATVEHPFGAIKAWMGAPHFKLKTLEKVKTEMSLHVLAYNLKRVIQILGVAPLLEAMKA